MDHIIQHWNLPQKETMKIEILKESVWSIGKKYILKYHTDVEELSRSIRLADLLNAEGIQAAQYIKTIDGRWTTPDGKYCLMEQVAGKHIDLFETDEMAVELGREIAHLHIALTKIDNKLTYKNADFLAEWQNHIKPGLVNISDEMIEQTENLLFKFYKNLPRQLIHRDIHPKNILFDKGKIICWIDFDLTCEEVRLFDLAYLLSGLLCGKIDNPAGIKAWKIIFKKILLGYNEISPLTRDERQSLPIMMVAIELLFVTFWNQKGNIVARNNAIKLARFLYNEMRCDY